MGKSNLKLSLALLLVAIAGIVVYSCRKSEGPPDPNASIPVNRNVVISAIGAFANDSIGQFNVAITSPSGNVNQVATGNTFVIKDPVAGNYAVAISKTGYAPVDSRTFSVTLPTDPKASFSISVSFLLTKVAASVTVTGSTGATIAVKANSEVTSSSPVANVTVDPGTVFTLADGTKPAAVPISVTNIPVNTDVAPTEIIGGVPTTSVATGVEIINNQIPTQKLDLQPSGLVLSQPMTIEVFIGNDYPAIMPVAEKIARQNGLTMNYVRKDGTVEVVSPDHFSADRNYVYYKITHFSQWSQLNKFVTIQPSLSKAQILTPEKTENGECGLVLKVNPFYGYNYSYPVTFLLTGNNKSVSYTVYAAVVRANPGAGYYASATYSFDAETYDLKDSTPGYQTTYLIRVPKSNLNLVIRFIPCHNQGGHNQGG
jgi:hypothetical protein